MDNIEWLIPIVAIGVAIYSYHKYKIVVDVFGASYYEVRLAWYQDQLTKERNRELKYDIPKIATYLDLPIEDICRFLKQKEARLHDTHTFDNSRE